MTRPTLELRCSRDLALRLGAVSPHNGTHFRVLVAAGHILIRDTTSGWPLFWAPVSSDVPANARSS